MDEKPYSSLSTAAIACVVLACVSLMCFLFPAFACVAILAIFCGVKGISQICKYQKMGANFAYAGILLSSFVAVTTPVWHLAQYRVEASAGFHRVNFAQLAKANQDEVFESLVGQKICLKGYAFPNSYRRMRSFLFSPDGNYRNPISAILVQLPPNQEWEWYPFSLAVSGRLVVNPEFKGDSNVPHFIMSDATVRKSRTPFGLKAQVRPGC